MVLFAEDFGPILGLLFLTPIVLTIASRVATKILRYRRGERPWWGFAIGSLSVLVGSAMLLMMLTANGGALGIFYLLAALPIITGGVCLITWYQQPRDRRQKPVDPRDVF